MDIINTVLHRNVSIDDRQAPDVGIFLQGIDESYKVLLSLSLVFAIVVFVLGAIQLFYVIKFISSERIQSDLYFLVLMFPTITLCGLGGMFIPRAATLLYSVALAYFMLCLFVVISLMMTIFGGRREMADWMLRNDKRIRLQVPPFCCWIKCLPEFKPTPRNIRRLEWTVFQTPIIRIVLEIMNLVVFMELGHRNNPWFTVSNLIGLCSMFLAFYGSYIMVPMGKEVLRPYRFIVIFRCVDIAQCLYTVQKFVFDFCNLFALFTPGELLTPGAKAQFFTSFMLTWEMMLMSILATYMMRPSKTQLFDKLLSPRRRLSTEGDCASASQQNLDVPEESRPDDDPTNSNNCVSSSSSSSSGSKSSLVTSSMHSEQIINNNNDDGSPVAGSSGQQRQRQTDDVTVVAEEKTTETDAHDKQHDTRNVTVKKTYEGSTNYVHAFDTIA